MLQLLAKSSIIFHYFIPVLVLARFEAMDLGPLDNCSTTMLHLLAKSSIIFHYFISVLVLARFEAMNLGPWDNCSKTMLHLAKSFIIFHYFIIVVVQAGFESMNLGPWDNCSTTVLPPLAKPSVIFSMILYQCQQQLDLNHQTKKTIVIPLCYHFWQSPPWFFLLFSPGANNSLIWTN